MSALVKEYGPGAAVVASTEEAHSSSNFLRKPLVLTARLLVTLL
jgi:hypothetical protein